VLNSISGTPEELDELRKFVVCTKKNLVQLQEEINQSAKVWWCVDILSFLMKHVKHVNLNLIYLNKEYLSSSHFLQSIF
jgi:uncharacterized protein YaeQ